MTDTAKQAQNSKASTKNKGNKPKKLKGDDLVKAVQKQIEFYLSRDNLQNDAYLVQQMDASLYVPVKVLANFPKIVSLTKEMNIILKAIKTSKVVQINGDDTLVKPDITMERNTIILRDVSSDVKKEDIIALFKEHNAKALNVRSDINDVWFVQMESEDAAREVLLKMMSSGKKLKGKPIRGGLKTESLLRSVTPKGGASPKNALSDGNSNNPSNMTGRNPGTGGSNMYSQPPPQNMGMPQMYPPMQNGMPPMYGYMNGMPQMPPAPYMNNGMGYQPYMNAPHMYSPRFMPGQGQGQQSNQKGGKGNRTARGNNNQSGYQQGGYQQANGYTRNSNRNNQMHAGGRGPRANQHRYNNNRNNYNNNYHQQNNAVAHNMNNANHQNNQHNNSNHQSSNNNSQHHNNKNHKVDNNNNNNSKNNKNSNNSNNASAEVNNNSNNSNNNSGNSSGKSRKNKKKGSKSDTNADNNNNSGNNSKSSKDKDQKSSKSEKSKKRRNSKNDKQKDSNANINVNSASDFPSLGGSSKPVSTKWGKGDASAIKRAPEQEASDAKKEAFARLKTNVNEGNAKKVVTNVIDNAVAQSNNKKTSGNNNSSGKNNKSSGKNKDNNNSNKNQQSNSSASAANNVESKQPVGDNKQFSWAATVAKTANVPVKPVASKSAGKNSDGGDGKKKKKNDKNGSGKKGDKSGSKSLNNNAKQGNASKSPGSSPNRNNQTGNSDNSNNGNNNTAPNDSSNKATATKTSAPAPRRGWERPELTKEREKLLKEKAQRESIDVAQTDGQQKDGGKKSKKKSGDSDKGNNKKSNNNKNEDSKANTTSSDSKGSNMNTGNVDDDQRERSNSNNGKPTFAEMLRKKQQAQQNKDKANSPGERGINQNVKNSRALAFADATGAQSSFNNAEKPEREFVRSDLQ